MRERERERERHCETCTCGLTYIEWSDRDGWVDLNNSESVAEAIINCSLDHSYDRTGDGIPYGIPDSIRSALAPVVAKHLSAVEPKWEDKTVYMDLEEDSERRREAFKRELIEACEREVKGGAGDR